MQIEIIKRNGSRVTFDSTKIRNAIAKGFYSVNNHDEAMIEIVYLSVMDEINNYNQSSITIEQIQDLVQSCLLKNNFDKVEKSFEKYRNDRNSSRERFNESQHKLLKSLEDFGVSDAKNHDLKRENANINGDSSMGLMLQYGSLITKAYTRAYHLRQDINEAFENGEIHIHDMDFYPMGTTTCLQIPLDKLFENGFSTGSGFIRAPKSIASAASLCAIAIQSNQNDQHGGQSIPLFDYYLAKSVIFSLRKLYKNEVVRYNEYTNEFDAEKLAQILSDIECLDDIVDITSFNHKIFDAVLKALDKEVYQAMESLIHNLNTMHSRAGAQVPFSSINFGTDTTNAGRMVSKNLMLAMESGLGHHETPIFPILIFKVKNGINYEKTDPNYDLLKLAIRCSSKRMFPNFAFLDAPFNFKHYDPNRKETEMAYMGCRTRAIANVIDKDNEIVVGRGNLSFTSINLVRLGIKHGIVKKDSCDMEAFYKNLDELIDLVCDQLIERFEHQCSRKVLNYPFLMAQGNWIGSSKLKINDTLQDVLKHGTLTIGFIGLAECLVALVGKHHGESADSQKLGLEIIGHMRSRCDELTLEKGLNITLIATPAEGLSGRFINIDKNKYGIIKGVTDREYYTNSFHVPVYYKTNIKNKLGLEAPYHDFTNGGHISYVEIDGDTSDNLDAFETIVRMMYDAKIGYGAINHPLDRDPVCNYNGIIKDVCPKCNREEGEISFERIRRITGYLVGTLDRFNNAKYAEVLDRVKHE